MEKHQNKLTTKARILWLALFSLWVFLGTGLVSWIPYPWSLFPIFGTLIPLVIIPLIAKKYKDSTMEKKDKGRGILDFEEILKKHSRNDESNQEEEIINYMTESIIEDNETSSKKQKSVIDYGPKRKKFITRY